MENVNGDFGEKMCTELEFFVVVSIRITTEMICIRKTNRWQISILLRIFMIIASEIIRILCASKEPYNEIQ